MSEISRLDYVAGNVRDMSSRIREARQARGLTVQDFSIECGLARSTIQDAESGIHANVSLNVLLTIAWALEIKPAELFGFINMRPQISPSEYELVQSHRRIFGAG